MMPFEAQLESDIANAKLRIGLVTPAWPGTATANGIATAVAHLAAGLEANGHVVTILAHRIDGPHDHPRVVVLPQRRMPLIERMVYRIAPDRVLKHAVVSRLVAAARLAIRLHRIEVVMMEETLGWAGALRRKLALPVVVTLHGPAWLHRATPVLPNGQPSGRREDWEAAGLQDVDGIIAPSQDVRDRTKAEWGLPKRPITVIGNPVSFGSDAPLAALAPEPRLLFVGRFDWIKGGDLVIETFARVAAAHPTCRFSFVGPDIGIKQQGDSLLTLASAVARLPDAIRTRIDLIGPRSRDEVAALRERHPITLIASRYETFGLALIEAMAAGSAVVSTRVGGCAEIVTDGKTGLLVPPEDPEALAAACLRLLADPQLAARLGQAAREDVRSRFSPNIVAREVAAFLAPICRGQERRPASDP
jgi:glycosyltransferase involved in cell wall biosynthesis